VPQLRGYYGTSCHMVYFRERPIRFPIMWAPLIRLPLAGEAVNDPVPFWVVSASAAALLFRTIVFYH
jgi:hypothetical protein